jgi:hypothetical protein
VAGSSFARLGANQKGAEAPHHLCRVSYLRYLPDRPVSFPLPYDPVDTYSRCFLPDRLTSLPLQCHPLGRHLLPFSSSLIISHETYRTQDRPGPGFSSEALYSSASTSLTRRSPSPEMTRIIVVGPLPGFQYAPPLESGRPSNRRKPKTYIALANMTTTPVPTKRGITTFGNLKVRMNTPKIIKLSIVKTTLINCHTVLRYKSSTTFSFRRAGLLVSSKCLRVGK